MDDESEGASKLKALWQAARQVVEEATTAYGCEEATRDLTILSTGKLPLALKLLPATRIQLTNHLHACDHCMKAATELMESMERNLKT